MLTSRANVSVVSSFARVFFFSRGPSLRLPKNLPIELPNGRRCAPQDVRAALCSVKYCCEMAEACLQPISRTCRNCSTAATTTMLDRFPSCDTHPHTYTHSMKSLLPRVCKLFGRLARRGNEQTSFSASWNCAVPLHSNTSFKYVLSRVGSAS